MPKLGLFLMVLGLGGPSLLHGQDKPDGNIPSRITITAPPVPPKPLPTASPEPVISPKAEKAVHIVVDGAISTGSHIPIVIVYYKGHAYVRDASFEIPADVVSYKGHTYAVLHMPGLSGYCGNLQVVKLGISKD